MSDRRHFLRGLAALPLIGGSVSLNGQPTAAAVPVTDDLLYAYNEWLFYERRLLCREHFGTQKGSQRTAMEGFIPSCGESFHFPSGREWTEVPKPSTRAAVVMATVGAKVGEVEWLRQLRAFEDER